MRGVDTEEDQKMIRRILSRIRSRRAFRRLSAAGRMSAECKAGAERNHRRLERTRRRLTSLKRQLEHVGDTLLEDVEEAQSVQRQHEVALEASRNENEVLSKVLIPTMTAADKLMLERYNAEIAIQVKRRVAAGPTDEVIL